MDRKNIYIRRSKISEAKFRLLVRPFALNLTATECAALTGISVRPVSSIYLRIRERMQQWCMQRSPLAGELEADESYFGTRRVKGKRGRGALGKTIGLLKRGDCVYTGIVPNASKATLQAIIMGKVDINSEFKAGFTQAVLNDGALRWLACPRCPMLNALTAPSRKSLSNSTKTCSLTTSCPTTLFGSMRNDPTMH